MTLSRQGRRDDLLVLVFAPRMPRRLLDEIERQSRRRVPIAEINRGVGEAAWRMRLPRPSYEQVRLLVHAARRLHRYRPRSVATLQLEFAYRVRSPEAILSELLEPRGPRLRDRAPPGK